VTNLEMLHQSLYQSKLHVIGYSSICVFIIWVDLGLQCWAEIICPLGKYDQRWL